MAQETRVYKDLDLNFSAHPVTKDVVKRIGNSAITGAIRNLVLTNRFEKPFKPTFGARIRYMLFEHVNFITASALETEIFNAITNFEPRVEIISVKVLAEPDKYGYTVTIRLSINNVEEPITITMFLEKVR
jgi:phage baseplate assembly protein W